MYDYGIEENEIVGLHDSRTNSIHYDNDMMIFDFPKGYYVIKDKEAIQTGKSNMQCHIIDKDFDGIVVYIYKTMPSGEVIREDYTDCFLSDINKGIFEFEFVTTYRSYQYILFKGYVWFDSEPYCYECEIELHTDKIFYSWNEN